MGTYQLSAALVATQQQRVIFTQGGPPATGWPAAQQRWQLPVPLSMCNRHGGARGRGRGSKRGGGAPPRIPPAPGGGATATGRYQSNRMRMRFYNN
mmetsp:Transcript_14323/g.31054  ORF Transcript_14323/g.31054 Transcript_14323/m.31054 type:complete len:96 (+) Transcript_14323:95-382(+)